MTLEEFIDLLDGKSTIGEADVAAFENRLPALLPTDYREFLLRTNGGEIAFNVNLSTAIASTGYDGFTGPASVFGINGEDSLMENRDVYAGRIPSELLMIASDWLGNGICIGLVGNSRGKVYFWDHELEGSNSETWDGALATCNATTLQADSFVGYVECLRVSTDET